MAVKIQREFMCQLEWNDMWKHLARLRHQMRYYFLIQSFLFTLLILTVGCCSNIYWKVCISAVGSLLVTEWLCKAIYYGGPEVQNTKQTKQNKNYVSLSFLHYFDTFLPKTWNTINHFITQFSLLWHAWKHKTHLEITKHIWKSQNTFGNHKTHLEITKHIWNHKTHLEITKHI
jgi:hypothetical protein